MFVKYADFEKALNKLFNTESKIIVTFSSVDERLYMSTNTTGLVKTAIPVYDIDEPVSFNVLIPRTIFIAQAFEVRDMYIELHDNFVAFNRGSCTQKFERVEYGSDTNYTPDKDNTVGIRMLDLTYIYTSVRNVNAGIKDTVVEFDDNGTAYITKSNTAIILRDFKNTFNIKSVKITYPILKRIVSFFSDAEDVYVSVDDNTMTLTDGVDSFSFNVRPANLSKLKELRDKIDVQSLYTDYVKLPDFYSYSCIKEYIGKYNIVVNIDNTGTVSYDYVSVDKSISFSFSDDSTSNLKVLSMILSGDQFRVLHALFNGIRVEVRKLSDSTVMFSAGHTKLLLSCMILAR